MLALRESDRRCGAPLEDVKRSWANLIGDFGLFVALQIARFTLWRALLGQSRTREQLREAGFKHPASPITLK
jgi:hypothetical protein